MPKTYPQGKIFQNFLLTFVTIYRNLQAKENLSSSHQDYKSDGLKTVRPTLGQKFKVNCGKNNHIRKCSVIPPTGEKITAKREEEKSVESGRIILVN